VSDSEEQAMNEAWMASKILAGLTDERQAWREGLAFREGWLANAALSAAQCQPEAGEAERLRKALGKIVDTIDAFPYETWRGASVEVRQQVLRIAIDALVPLAQPARDGGAGDEHA